MKNHTFLYVEDDPTTQQWITLSLKEDFKEFYQAYDGEEGLELYKKYKPDIILTDIHLPKLDGIAMSRAIKALDKDQTILVHSATNEREKLIESIEIGIDGFLPKPIDLELLNEKLNQSVQKIRERKELERLRDLAYYDMLTKIPNRVLFHKKLDLLLQKISVDGGEFTLLFIDLDNFKNINDTYGHAAGDRVLSTIAQRISDLLSPKEIFARLSGDEFAIILQNISNKSIIDKIATEVLEAASKPILYGESMLSISCSIGISRFPYDCNSKETLIHLADTAMYRAKKLGKSKFFYIQELNKENHYGSN